MADHNTREGKFKREFGGVAIGGALAAFLVSPLLKFANPVALAIAGLLAGMGLLGLYNARVVSGVKPVAEKLAWCFLFAGGCAAAFALVYAQEASSQLDRYCRVLQSRLIQADREHKALGNAKDVFQTLQCRPQGEVFVETQHDAGQ
ncbi:hypothetical protein ACSBM8_01315 [Sphingomonas sp. ASY06-1R]|uniref:hypothetical protein n=1 Tax=Sphingomonas sp. ASY06-1R TaxID=3445771 RepID=UPI003FA2B418